MKLLAALNDAGIVNVNEDLLQKYAVAIVVADPGVETLADIQDVINEVNEKEGKEVDETAAVKAVVEAETQIQLLNALKANFERVNADWIVAYYKDNNVNVTDEKAKFDEIQVAIDDINEENVRAAYGKAFESLKLADVNSARALANDYLYEIEDLKDNQVQPTEYALDELDMLEAVIRVNNATTNNSLKNALVALDNLEDELVEKYEDNTQDFVNKFEDDFDIDDVVDANLAAYRDALKDEKLANTDKNQSKDIATIINNVNIKVAEKAEQDVLEALGEVNNDTPAADVVKLLEKAIELRDNTNKDNNKVNAAYADAYRARVATTKEFGDLEAVNNLVGQVNLEENAKLGIVATAEQLKTALGNTELDTITLAANITIEEPVVMRDNLTIDGAGNTLLIKATSDENNNTADGLYIKAGTKNAVVKNLTVRGTHNDNLIEIYSDATLENVKAIGGAKAGIYVNNDGTGTITVNFKNIETAGNRWNAGIGIVSRQLGSKVIANFEGIKSLEDVAVYTDDIYKYHGEYEINGLDDFRNELVNDRDEKGKITQTQWKWFSN